MIWLGLELQVDWRTLDEEQLMVAWGALRVAVGSGNRSGRPDSGWVTRMCNGWGHP